MRILQGLITIVLVLTGTIGLVAAWLLALAGDGHASFIAVLIGAAAFVTLTIRDVLRG